MPSEYLTAEDCADYGAAGATPQQIQQASTLIDAYLERPEGLAWADDASGLPCYMPALTPSLALKLQAAIAPGRDVVVASPLASAGLSDLVGEVFVLDRTDTSLCEAVVVSAVDTMRGTLTLRTVVNSHSAGATMEAGLQILEERALASKRSVSRLTRWPIVRILSGLGRYSYGRRSDQVAGLYNDQNLLAALQTFGGPPQWVPWDVTQASVSVATGEIWVPAGMLLAYYSEIRVRYVAGFPSTSIPSVVKQATANMIATLQRFGDVSPAFKIAQAGDTRLERWAQSNMDGDTRNLLEPYRLKLHF
jgi:hypothetical protein